MSMDRNYFSWLILLFLPVPVSAQVRPVNLPLPAYPPLAIQARIQGQVQIELKIAPDGSVISSEVISGPPLLTHPVTDSLAQARFACDGCVKEPHTFRMIFDFVLPDHSAPEQCEEFFKTGHASGMPPSTLDSPGHVTIRPRQPLCWDEKITMRRARSVRCLWLWRCGWKLD